MDEKSFKNTHMCKEENHFFTFSLDGSGRVGIRGEGRNHLNRDGNRIFKESLIIYERTSRENKSLIIKLHMGKQGEGTEHKGFKTKSR